MHIYRMTENKGHFWKAPICSSHTIQLLASSYVRVGEIEVCVCIDASIWYRRTSITTSSVLSRENMCDNKNHYVVDDLQRLVYKEIAV